MPVQIPRHSHCAICSEPVAYYDSRNADADERTCSKECQKAFEEIQRKRKRSVYTMYALMALAVLILLMSMRGALPA